MVAEDPCPSADDLTAFAAGTLDLAVMDVVAAHVVRCAACDAMLSWTALAGAANRVTPAGPAGSGTVVSSAPPTTFADRYRLGDRLGAGGMGHVYRAEQVAPIRRTVAVKVLKPGLDSADFLARFETERQAVARMDHPNIARLYDAGLTDEGRPYFALELIPGEGIVAHADTHKLTPRERVSLFVPVCRAIQHAHQKGVIHRDLKPSNVLVAVVDGVPVPKVIDFGIAKAFAEDAPADHATRPGLVVGTPEYMSPEQAAGPGAGDIDTRSDIYSLGVLLYELLTGTTPFTLKTGGGSVWDLLRTIRDVDAPRPSTHVAPPAAAARGGDLPRLRRQLAGDLDWVLMKALARDRDQRYPTANAFAADLERYLANEPVTAGPPSRTYRVRKFVTRNRTAVAASVAVAVALVAGTTAATVGLFRSLTAERTAREAEQTALAALGRESQARAEAVESDRIARDQLTKTEAAEKQARADQTRARAAEGLAKEQEKKAVQAEAHTRTALFAATDVVVEDVLKKSRQFSPAESAFLKQLRGLYEQLAGSSVDDPVIYLEGVRRLAILHDVLGSPAEAEAVYAKAIAAVVPAADRPDAPHLTRLAVVRAHLQLGFIRTRRGKPAEAEASFRACAAACRAMADADPTDHEARGYLARAHGNIALLKSSGPEADGGRREFQEAIRVFAELAGEHPLYRRDHAIALSNAAQDRINRSDYAAALPDLRAALAIRETLHKEASTEVTGRELARAWSLVGSTFQALGRPPEAEPALAAAADTWRELADQYPAVPEYPSEYAQATVQVVALRARLGRRSAIGDQLEKAVAVLEAIVRKYPDVPVHRLGLAQLYSMHSDLMLDIDPKAALAAIGRGFEVFKPIEKVVLDGPQQRHVRMLLCRGRALALDALGRHKEAVVDWNEAGSLAPPPDRPAFLGRLVESMARAGDRSGAERILKEFGKNPPPHIGLHLRMAVTHAFLSADGSDDHADRAVSRLADAIRLGLTERDEIDREADFRKLADRDDYKAVVAKMPRREPAPLPRRAE